MVGVNERVDAVDCYLGAAEAEHGAALGGGEAREGEEGEELHRGGEGEDSKSEGGTREENLEEEAKKVASFGRKVFIRRM